MITASDSYSVFDINKYFIILPSENKSILKKILKKTKVKKVKEGFSYNSATNKSFLTVNQIRSLIKRNINKKFKPH